MTTDVYAPCPCGSGKKLKFCCHAVIDEMEKVARLLENRQSRMAHQLLDTIEKSHPNTPWVIVTRAIEYIESNEPALAEQELKRLLEKEPEHDFALVLYAIAALDAYGYDAAKKAVHRAYQRCVRKFPAMTARLAMGTADYMARESRYLAAREHLAFAMRLSPEHDRQSIFVSILEMDNDTDVPYPLRSTHHLPHFSGTEEEEKELKRAARLGAIACWDSAADLYARLAADRGDAPELWHSAGLCRAWDGDETAAAEALHRAARLYGDFETAVECETLAQLFDVNTTEQKVQRLAAEYGVASVARLLTHFGDHPRIARMELGPAEDLGEGAPAAVFRILDRPEVPEHESDRLTLETVPVILGQAMVFAADPERGTSARLLLIAVEGADWEHCESLVREAGGEELEYPEREKGLAGESPAVFQPLFWELYFSPGTPQIVGRRITLEKWGKSAGEVWPTLPQPALGNRSPDKAAGDPELKVPLMAALYVLDALCDRNGFTLDWPPLLERLQLEPPRKLEVTGDTQLGSLSAMQLHRLPIAELNDAQLQQVLKRALLVHHDGFLYELLTEFLKRPESRKTSDCQRAYTTLVTICREQLRREEGLHWIRKAREATRDGEGSFENLLHWDLTELVFRLEDPSDPGIQPLVQRFWSYYVPKLPQLEEKLVQLLDMAGVQAPTEIGVTAGAGAVSSGGIWTPGQEASGGQKLWLPGQE